MFRKYWEMGFSVIPLHGKAAIVSEWQRWCHELPPKELIDQWDRRFKLPFYGIGLVCGPASNIDGLDIDSDSEDILTMCPRSPLNRKGMRGAVMLFQHNPKLIKREQDRDNQTPNEIPKDTEGVQVLSIGNYFVIPPSMHPDIKRPYKWVGEYNLENFSVSDLDMLTQDQVDSIMVYISRFPLKGIYGSSMKGCGRNNTLTVACYAKIKQDPNKLDYDVAEELLEFDETHNVPSYFSDPREMYYRKAPTPFGRALLFVKGSRVRMTKKGDL